MKKRYQIGVLGVVAAATLVWVVTTKQAPNLFKKGASTEPPQERVPKGIEPESGDITEEELVHILEGTATDDATDLSATLGMYTENHLLYNDPEAPCNQGVEGLKNFIEHFCADEVFQKERTKIDTPEEEIPRIIASDLTISNPDSTGYFSGWKEITADEATFCTGWLDAEAELFYHFQRQPAGKWYLVGYVGDL